MLVDSPLTESSIINDIFVGTVVNTMTGDKCKHSSTTVEHFAALTVALPQDEKCTSLKVITLLSLTFENFLKQVNKKLYTFIKRNALKSFTNNIPLTGNASNAKRSSRV